MGLPCAEFRRLAIAATLLSFALAAQAGAAPVRPFAPDSVWNKPLGARPALSPRSGVLVASLRSQLRVTPPWIATTTYSTPVYRVGSGALPVPVQMDAINPILRLQNIAVPVPDGAVPSQDSDGRMVVWQRSTDTMWEFWRMRRQLDGWHATYGGRIDHVSESSGVHPAPLGSTASGLALMGGLITPAELRVGRFDHALALGVPNTQQGVFVPPANRTDGATPAGGIPMGTRLRLNPNVNVSKLGLPRAARIIARAAQRYGMIVRDTSGTVAFYGEEVRGRPSPWTTLLGGLSPSQLLMRFPYGQLQVVAP
ncbi:MAG: hypothetical protein QOG68_1419 [Solirubrobacteraceae bacterium]|nr:hypothetical protein [Solirubrobacteraceae bacterium]